MARIVLVFLFGLTCFVMGHVAAQTLSSPQGMNFGPITYTNPMNGNITMGTNGTVTYTANTDGPGVGTPGQVLITATAGTTANIRCRNNADIANPSGSVINIQPVRISMGTGTTYAAATQCGGLNTTIITHVVTGNAAQDTVLVGGRLRINAINATNNVYNSSNPGGRAATIRVIFV